MRIAFESAGLGSFEPYVVVDPRFVRPAEVDLLIGDPGKAKRGLGWEPTVSFEETDRNDGSSRRRPSFRNVRALVTGASGFVGGYLLAALRGRGVEVLACGGVRDKGEIPFRSICATPMPFARRSISRGRTSSFISPLKPSFPIR